MTEREEDGIDGLDGDELFTRGEEARYLFREITVDEGQRALRVDKLLASKLEGASRSFIQKALEDGLVTVSGKTLKPSYRVKPGEVISIFQTYAPQCVKLLPEAIPLDVVYEDEWMMVVNKPAGMVVHPGHGHFSGTLVNALLYYFRDLPLFQQEGMRPGLAHRIDKDTSGLLVVGKTAEVMARLGCMFQQHVAYRWYEALVWGRFDADEGTIVGNVGRDPANRQRMKVFPDGSAGKEAVTHWHLEQDFTFVSLVSCVLETGRMHQIRAHMAHVGHPIFGDERYGGHQVLRGVQTGEYMQFVGECLSLCPHQALHAGRLEMPHPLTGEPMRFLAPRPSNFNELLQRWALHSENPPRT